jgi:hypothetical protein
MNDTISGIYSSVSNHTAKTVLGLMEREYKPYLMRDLIVDNPTEQMCQLYAYICSGHRSAGCLSAKTPDKRRFRPCAVLERYMSGWATIQELAHHRCSGCGITEATRRNFAL